MNRQIALLLGLALVCSILLIGASSVNAVSKEQKAIDKAISSAASWKAICDVGITTGFNQSLKLVFHKDVSRCNGVIPPPNPPPNPPPVPTPTGNTSKVCLVGDLSGTSITSKMNNCNLKIGLGDLGYKSDLSWFKSLNFNKCVIGNHDAPEDGSSSIYQEALSYCGDHWSQGVGKSTLIIGMNTNGDVNTQVNFVKSLPLANYKTVIFVSHKGGHVLPNSHHPNEAKSLYQQLEALVPVGVTTFEIVGHNHVMSSAPSMNWYQSGAGGKSHYSCGTDSIWTFCDNSNYGYLELTIDNNNGNTVAKFIN